MGSSAAAPVSASTGTNPFLTNPLNLTEIGRLYRDDRAAHDRYKAEASRG
jgi:hypothetical protein